MRLLDCNQSLHLFGAASRLRYVHQHALQLLGGLDAALLATELAAPVRCSEPYLLKRSAAGNPVHEEARWERTIWSEWNVDLARGEEFIPGVSGAVLTYQMMLRDTNRDSGWGEVDLVGVSPQSLPLAIELKGPSSRETPLRGIVESVAYTIAIRKAWPRGLKEQWQQRLHRVTAPGPITEASTVFAAPAEYWDRVLGRLGPAWRVSKEGWASTLRLCEALARRGLRVVFVRLEAEDATTPRGVQGRVVTAQEITEAVQEFSGLSGTGANAGSARPGGEMFYLDANGVPQDAELWEHLLGDDIMPDELHAPPLRRQGDTERDE